jgi:hypothetical protein
VNILWPLTFEKCQGPGLPLDNCNSIQLGVIFVVVLSVIIALILILILAYSLNCQVSPAFSSVLVSCVRA